MFLVSEIVALTGRKKSKIYADIKKGKLTKEGKYIVADEKYRAYINTPLYCDKPPQPLPQKKDVFENVDSGSFKKHVSMDDVAKMLTCAINKMLVAYDNVDTRKLAGDRQLVNSYREWVKLGSQHLKVCKDIELRKNVDKGSTALEAFKEIRRNTFLDAQNLEGVPHED